MRAMAFLRNEWVLVSLWSAFVGTVWMAPAMFGYAMHIADHDTALYYYPIFDFYAKALQSGNSFLWIPGLFSGFPVYASQTGGFFEPLNLLIFSWFSGIQGVHVRLWIDIVATCALSYAVARSFGISKTVSALVGPSYLIAFHLRFLSNPVIANTLFLTPLLLLLANRILAAPSNYRYAVVWGLGVGMALLGGYTQMVLYSLLAVGLYIAIRLALVVRERNISLLGKVAAQLGCGTVLGVIIGLPLIIPAATFLPFTPRTEAPTYAQATLKVIQPTDLVLFAIPDHIYIPYVTSGRMPLYVGTFLFLCALSTLLYAVHSVRYRWRSLSGTDANLISLAAVSLVFLVLAIQYSPLYYLLSKLPFFALFRFPYRFMYIGIFFVALLGAIGFDNMREYLKQAIVRKGILVASICMGALAAAVLILNMLTETVSGRLVATASGLAQSANLYALLGLDKGAEHYAGALERAVAASRELLAFSDPHIGIPFTILSVVIVIFGLLLRGVITIQLWRRFGIGVTVATVVAIPVLRYTHFVPIADAGTAPHAAMQFASADDVQRYRFYSFLLSEGTREAIPPQYKLSPHEERALLQYNVQGGYSNYFLYSSMGSVDGYDPFESSDTLRAMEMIGGEYAAGYGNTVSDRSRRLLEHLDILAMMGGKYILSGAKLENSHLTLKSADKITELGIPLYVYALEARPKYYLARDVVERRHASFADLMSQGQASFATSTYVSCSGCSPAQSSGALKVLRQAPGLYEFSVNSTGRELLVVSESNLPGWTVVIQKKPAELLRVNGLYMGVAVPAGESSVRFEYQGLHNELPILKALNIVQE